MSGKTSVKDVAKKASSIKKKSKSQIARENKMADEMSKEELDVAEPTLTKLAPPAKESVGSGVNKTVDDEDIRVKMEENDKKPRVSGKWIKISSKAELVKYEMAGQLAGWDPVTSQVLLND